MKPKRIFQVYRELLQPKDALGRIAQAAGLLEVGDWRWRLIAARNGQIVGGSQEAFDSKANALRAARREASMLKDGFAAVEVAE